LQLDGVVETLIVLGADVNAVAKVYIVNFMFKRSLEYAWLFHWQEDIMPLNVARRVAFSYANFEGLAADTIDGTTTTKEEIQKVDGGEEGASEKSGRPAERIILLLEAAGALDDWRTSPPISIAGGGGNMSVAGASGDDEGFTFGTSMVNAQSE
jgi:hypothetical protein